MAASQNILRLFIAMVAIIISFASHSASNSIHGAAGLDLESGAAGEHQTSRSEHSNDTKEAGRKFRWPSSASITIHRAAEVNSQAGAAIEQQIEQNVHNDGSHQHRSHSAHGNDTAGGERKFRWPGSVGITIHRAGEVNSQAEAAIEQQIEQNKHNDGSHQHHNHSAQDNDTANSERKFHWPGSIGININRAGEVDSEAGAAIEQQIGESEHNNGHHHQHNHSAQGDNDTASDERKFHWPSSVTFSIHRSGELSQDGADASNQSGQELGREEKLFDILPSLVSCNHTEQAGRSCSDCTHTLLCFSNDIGIQRDCAPLYCNNGMCSIEPSVSCNATLSS